MQEGGLLATLCVTGVSDRCHRNETVRCLAMHRNEAIRFLAMRCSEPRRLSYTSHPPCRCTSREEKVMYVKVSTDVGCKCAQYLKRLNDGVIPAGVLQQEYVQLPTLFGGSSGGGGRKEGVELESHGGSRPCKGMKSSDRIVQVENASDRIIMVDVGGGDSGSSWAGGRKSDKTSVHSGYQ